MASDVKPSLAWPEAARLVSRWLAERERIDGLMLRASPAMDTVERARCQHLVFGVVRHAGRLEGLLARLIAHPPRFVTRATLYVLGFELLEAGAELTGENARGAKIVHHAVEQAKALASPAEVRLVNAVGRRLVEAVARDEAPPRLAPAERLAEYFSHPLWLVSRWLAAYGAGPTRSLLEWNQTAAEVTVRWRAAGEAPPEWLSATAWPGFYLLDGRHWAEVEDELGRGRIYIQDPGTRLAIDLLAPRPGESWLDACAAPGGKSLLIADRAGSGRLVAADLGGPEPDDRQRFERLQTNLGTIRGVEASAVALDLRNDPDGPLRRKGLPLAYDAVLLDAPCSNTGVMRHRADVKWRLQEGDFARHARQQRALLAAAARWVMPGGRLVYSTCSIDAEENEQVVERFLAHHPRFRLERQVLARPWDCRHDGAGVFLLRHQVDHV